MSAILGIWNKNKPLQPQVLQRMEDRISHRAIDGIQRQVDGNTAFSFLACNIAREDVHQEQPFKDGRGNLLLFDGRLDNREDLLRLLTDEGLSVEDGDAGYVMAAIRRWGSDAYSKLVGDFAFAHWNQQEQTLVLGRDVMGARPLYYLQNCESVLFATEIKALLAHPEVHAGPNKEAIVEYLTRAYDYANPHKTFFEGIEAVGAGQLAILTATSVRMRTFRDFDPYQELRLRDTREYVDGYRHHFLNAVRRRLRSTHPVAIMASGGLDSSSILCSAQKLSREIPDAPLLIGIAVEVASEDAHETEFQKALEEQCGFSLERVSAREAHISEYIEHDVRYAEAPFAQWRDWRTVWSVAAQKGARILLSGYFGDQLAGPYFMVDLVRRLHWLNAVGAFEDYTRREYGGQAGARRLMLRRLRSHALPAALKEIRGKVRSHRNVLPDGYSVELQQFASKHLRTIQSFRPSGTTAHARASYQFAKSLIHSWRVAIGSAWESQFGIQTLYPFRDPDLVAYVMSIPGEVTFWNNVPRGLHREAMAGILPDSVRLRLSKADFSAFARQGALKDLDTFRPKAPMYGVTHGWLKEVPELQSYLGRLKLRLQAETGVTSAWETQDFIALNAWLNVFWAFS